MALRRGSATGLDDRRVKRSKHGSDRLSALDDATLIHILSLLPTDEAVRTSVLSRRWRRLYATVPVVDIVDPNSGRDGKKRDFPPMCFDQKVTCVLLSRDPTAPIRAFRLDAWNPTRTLLDQWIVVALRSGVEELELKLRCEEYSGGLRLCPFELGERSSADFDEGDQGRYVKTPRQLFHSAALRRLSLSRWSLEVPGDGGVPLMTSLQSLVLHRIMGSGLALQRLISRCPGLVDVTLEECPGVTTLTVTSESLRRFALVCCHNASRIELESRAVRSLRYKGGLPGTGRSLFWIADHATLTALTIDICQSVRRNSPREIATVTNLIARCTNLEFLHLSLRPAMAYYSSLFTSDLRRLLRLRRLELKGSLHSEHSVSSVSDMLQNTPKLKDLSLFLIYGSSDHDNKQVINYSGPVHVPHGVRTAPVRCFKHSLRRISLVGYRGRPFERMIAKFLLSKAVALEELSVSLAPESCVHRVGIERELKSWRFFLDNGTKVPASTVVVPKSLSYKPLFPTYTTLISETLQY